LVQRKQVETKGLTVDGGLDLEAKEVIAERVGLRELGARDAGDRCQQLTIMGVAPGLRREARVVPERVIPALTDARGPRRRLREVVLPFRVEESVQRARRCIASRYG